MWSHTFLILYIGLLFFVYFWNASNRFFVADDFSWIRWAKDSNPYTLLLNFVDAQGFFFRPVDKAVIFVEYNFFGLNPYPYYIMNFIFNFLTSIAAYFLFLLLLRNKLLAFLGALIFSFLPSHTQNLYWIATLSTTLSTLFILFGLSLYYQSRVRRNFTLGLFAMLSFFLAVFSYENAIIFIFLMAALDIFIFGKKLAKKKSHLYTYYFIACFITLLYLVLRSFANAAGFSGDYNYNLVKALPNSAGNYLGYALVLFSGEHFLNIYNFIRDSLKQYWIVISVVGIFIFAFFGGFFIEHKEKIHFSNTFKLFIFGFFFSVFALLPYLPLGNITLRYVYLSSFGYIFMLLVVLNIFISKYSVHVRSALCILIAVVFVISSYFYMKNAVSQWTFASQVTYESYKYFNKQNSQLLKNVYIYNIPIKRGEAYIFPVGIVDMIYLSNNKITPYLTRDLESSQALYNKDKNQGIDSEVVTFDNNFRIQKVYEK